MIFTKIAFEQSQETDTIFVKKFLYTIMAITSLLCVINVSSFINIPIVNAFKNFVFRYYNLNTATLFSVILVALALYFYNKKDYVKTVAFLYTFLIFGIIGSSIVSNIVDLIIGSKDKLTFQTVVLSILLNVSILYFFIKYLLKASHILNVYPFKNYGDKLGLHDKKIDTFFKAMACVYVMIALLPIFIYVYNIYMYNDYIYSSVINGTAYIQIISALINLVFKLAILFLLKYMVKKNKYFFINLFKIYFIFYIISIVIDIFSLFYLIYNLFYNNDYSIKLYLKNILIPLCPYLFFNIILFILILSILIYVYKSKNVKKEFSASNVINDDKSVIFK